MTYGANGASPYNGAEDIPDAYYMTALLDDVVGDGFGDSFFPDTVRYPLTGHGGVVYRVAHYAEATGSGSGPCKRWP